MATELPERHLNDLRWPGHAQLSVRNDAIVLLGRNYFGVTVSRAS